MTRIEKIRQMTDEELAELLMTEAIAETFHYCNDDGPCTADTNFDELPEDACKQCMVRWLQEEGELIDRRHR